MSFITNILIKLIKGYQFLISPFFGHSCRYLPTCSDYSIDALKEYGLIKGIFLGIKRILRCRTGCSCGIDPIPKIKG